MQKEKLLTIVENIEHKSNKDLFEAEQFLFEEFEKSKILIIDLSRHMDSIEEMYNKVVNEIENRKKTV